MTVYSQSAFYEASECLTSPTKSTSILVVGFQTRRPRRSGYSNFSMTRLSPASTLALQLAGNNVVEPYSVIIAGPEIRAPGPSESREYTASRVGRSVRQTLSILSGFDLVRVVVRFLASAGFNVMPLARSRRDTISVGRLESP
jgi:hypothetical protein